MSTEPYQHVWLSNASWLQCAAYDFVTSASPTIDSELKVFVRVGAGESRRYESIIGSSLETVQQEYESFVQKSGAGEFSNNEKQEIAGAILKRDEA